MARRCSRCASGSGGRSQPHKEAERRRQRARIVQIALVVVLVLVLAGGVLGLFAYYNSRGFVDEIRGKIGTWTGAEVEFQQFRVTPVSAGAITLDLRWPDGNPLRDTRVAECLGRSADDEFRRPGVVRRGGVGQDRQAAARRRESGRNVEDRRTAGGGDPVSVRVHPLSL